MSDINGLVTGLQGFPISNMVPQDGYVLAWNGNEWEPTKLDQSQGKLKVLSFLTNGNWTCPNEVTRIIVWGQGGGGAGGAGSTNIHGAVGGGGGGAAILTSVVLDVIPNTNYSITIGTGGVGSSMSTNNGDGGNGANTLFDNKIIFFGAHGGRGGKSFPFSGIGGSTSNTCSNTIPMECPGYGGMGGSGYNQKGKECGIICNTNFSFDASGGSSSPSTGGGGGAGGTYISWKPYNSTFGGNGLSEFDSYSTPPFFRCR